MFEYLVWKNRTVFQNSNRENNMKTFYLFFTLFSILFTSVFFSQNISENSEDSYSSNLKGVNSIYLIGGFKMNSSSTVSARIPEVETETNFTGSLGYQYWFDNEWAVKTSIGVFQAESNVSILAKVTSISIVPIVFGFSYYPEYLSLGSVGRVNVGINAGAYVGSGTKTGISFDNIGTTTITETVFGVEPNVGIDFFISKWFRIGPIISYHFIGDYNDLIISDEKHSGAVISFVIGLQL